MPTEQTPLEYYHYYRASQRRVRQWVQKTSRELEAATPTGRSSDLRPVKEDNEDAGHGQRRGGNGGAGAGASQDKSPSSSSLKHHDLNDRTRSRGSGPSSRSRSTRKKPKTDDHDNITNTNNNHNIRSYHTRSRKHHSESSDGLAISSLLPFGLVPLIFALTPPSVATLFSATILLAGYFFVDYSKKESVSDKL